MKQFIVALVVLPLLILHGCNKPKKNYQCENYAQTNFANHYEALEAFPTDVFSALYNSKGPLSDGSLGRNQDGYFSVRFQMDMYFVCAHATRSQSTSVLDEFLKTVEYSFDHQLPNGNFDLIVPAELSDLPSATEADSSSGVAFFMSALGNSILTLTQSPWFNSLSDTSYQNRLNDLVPQIQLSLDWLKTKEAVLLQADASAPNRLFFNALAFYTLGKWLNDVQAQNIGINFMLEGMAMRHEKGYFRELDGWDSSYQGVGVLNGFMLVLAVNNGDPIHGQLWNSIACACDWQKSRILKNGEISLKDNTRVYEGGEEFLGQEKGIAWLDTYFSFLLMDFLSGQSEFGEKAIDVRSYYE